MKNLMNELRLHLENILHAGSGGRSQENAGLGFNAAFLDCDTMTIYRSCFRDGRPAPMHLLDGLPAEVVVHRAPSGRVLAAKASLVSGFERNGFFFTRAAAARAAAEWGQAAL
ncbi:MAG TPA: hypothetical protein VLV56_08045 [Burkholderiales bacterium]|nr:hypothetical protein [Burkholderiales bacterium]HUP09001.1 hypothetical protein [Caldimonas sp.]